MALSPNMLIIKEYVEDKYGDQITHIGVENCRKIAGSQTYSQHSWPNAIDIHVTNEFRANAIEKANGDAIFADLQRTFGDDLYEKIWWTTNHWNHIHVSTYPRGWLTPPCAGGTLRIRYKNGTTENVSEFPQTIEQEEDVTIEELRAELAAHIPLIAVAAAKEVLAGHLIHGRHLNTFIRDIQDDTNQLRIDVAELEAKLAALTLKAQ